VSHDDGHRGFVVIIGPIKHWWDENWDTQEHWLYEADRNLLSKVLVNRGYLVYRPHEAFKGPWVEAAQAVNDVAIRRADLVINITPYGIPSEGTDEEMRQVFIDESEHGVVLWLDIRDMPVVDWIDWVEELLP